MIIITSGRRARHLADAKWFALIELDAGPTRSGHLLCWPGALGGRFICAPEVAQGLIVGRSQIRAPSLEGVREGEREGGQQWRALRRGQID